MWHRSFCAVRRLRAADVRLQAHLSDQRLEIPSSVAQDTANPLARGTAPTTVHASLPEDVRKRFDVLPEVFRCAVRSWLELVGASGACHLQFAGQPQVGEGHIAWESSPS